jgi:hypothetical protein
MRDRVWEATYNVLLWDLLPSAFIHQTQLETLFLSLRVQLWKCVTQLENLFAITKNCLLLIIYFQ